MFKVGICGNFGGEKNSYNGQTIKTLTISELLEDEFGKEQVIRINTENWKRHPIKVLVSCQTLVKECKNIIILPSKRGVKIFVPLFLLFNLRTKRKLHYAVIGGWLPSFLNKHNFLRRCLKKYVLYVESVKMKAVLEKGNINKVFYIPNFKNIEPEKSIKNDFSEPYTLCTFSRVMKEKGIEKAIAAVVEVNKKAGRKRCSLDIYGSIEQSYKDSFENLQNTFPEYIRYCGVVPPNESTKVLKNYYALLFLTFYDGEGFPGTLTDALASGLPVIASNWKYNNEIIEDEKTGYIVNNDNEIVNKIEKAISSKNNLATMRDNCLKEAQKYTVKRNKEILLSQLE